MWIPHVVALLAASAALVGGSSAATGKPLHRQLELAARIDRAVIAGRGGSAVAIQERYNSARELDESLRGVSVPRGCLRLATSFVELAASEVALTEAFDRARAWRPLEQRSRRALEAVDRERLGCRAGSSDSAAPLPVVAALSLPGPGEVFFGRVAGRAPARAARVVIRVNGVRAAAAAVTGGRFSALVSARAGKAVVEALFIDSRGKQLGATASRNTWLLPPSASQRRAQTRVDRGLSTRLAAAGLAFDGYGAIHTERLAGGIVAGWNDDALFPAASTVKLAVMLEAARRYGLASTSPVRYDVERAASWSSNLAANRLLEMIGRGRVGGGVGATESRLRALGATSSTYPGEYRVGTSRFGAPRQPPLNTERVTTARDLATVLRRIHLAALGDAGAGRATGMSSSTARTLLRMLLESEAVGDNVGLIHPFLPAGIPAAQKHGWLSDARATAAIVYGPEGPVILVVMGYRGAGLSLVQAQALGAKASRLALQP